MTWLVEPGFRMAKTAGEDSMVARGGDRKVMTGKDKGELRAIPFVG